MLRACTIHKGQCSPFPSIPKVAALRAGDYWQAALLATPLRNKGASRWCELWGNQSIFSGTKLRKAAYTKGTEASGLQGSVRCTSLAEVERVEGIPYTSGMAPKGGKKAAPSQMRKMLPMSILEEHVLRWDADEASRKHAFPSLSFADATKRETALEGGATGRHGAAFVPRCKEKNDMQITEMEFPLGTSFYGGGEVSGPLERSGTRIFAWNTDAWGYGRATSSLYQSHPWVLVLLPDGTALGVLADTTRKCELDLREQGLLRFSASAPYPLITFGPYPSPDKVVAALARATGFPFLPSRWALGYHQCRFSYETADRVKEVAATFREKQIPCDVIWMDIDYMDKFRCFTFDKLNFADPKQLAADLHEQGFRAVWMIDPGISATPGYFAYDSGAQQDAWILKKDGKPFIGDVWPGPCAFPDFTIERVRQWWAGLIADYAAEGVDGIWNDMNEPAVFKVINKTMPDSNVHRGDPGLGGRQAHTHYHNVYGMLMARSTFEGLQQARPDQRPFVLTRANYIGGHRYAATWTGDNLANWEHLHFSIPMVLNLGLSGQPFSGPDIGGFVGDSNPRLYGRWMGIGALLPFARGHSETGTIDHEPWSFGAECEAVCRAAILRRYRLLPHLYTLFHRAHTQGLPVASPLFFADPADPTLRGVEDCFLLGPLLVAASTDPASPADRSRLTLPKGAWRSFDFADFHPDLPLLLLRGGGIVPAGRAIQHTAESTPDDPLTLIVSLDENGAAEGLLFEDENEGYAYRSGGYLLTTYEAVSTSGQVTVRVQKTEGSRARPRRKLAVRLLLEDGVEVTGDGWDGEPVAVALPSPQQLQAMVAAQQNQRKTAVAGPLSEAGEDEPVKGAGTTKTIVEMASGAWLLRVAPWAGGRIVSLVHAGSGRELLAGTLDKGGYEEYTGTEYRSPGCTEPYRITAREVEQLDGEDAVGLEADVGGGLALTRRIAVPRGMPDVVQINSAIEARSIGAGSGGFSRLVCLRAHPSFKLANPANAVISFKSVRGDDVELTAEFGEATLRGDDRPNGVWTLSNSETGLAIANHFEIDQVAICFVHWEATSVNLELWSQERPVSAESPIQLSHYYSIKEISK
ncbi:Glucosidase II catalytic (alpha) subunit and related enzymes [Klebsormidium nitens]|uniref:Glucosidase II catalytic (Alpha) subunit and related enzymes n=1 Tax=Klebsormidium nitens TaxID=105231 RepID=A0A1Y1IAC3_KLENI|nr:Glucosidase II catalytic (alpha) subunit and related enzymes [Klebsormidium nitens]|eukprot:GAQ86902.1 Glucosidase II catalytic (alpha) subunit and related enzymes [Klebsormidium nitens]